MSSAMALATSRKNGVGVAQSFLNMVSTGHVEVVSDRTADITVLLERRRGGEKVKDLTVGVITRGEAAKVMSDIV